MSRPDRDALDVDLAGLHLIEASAGTGKTHTISTLYLRLLLEAGLPGERILVVTFTEAATAELRDRIRRRLRDCLQMLDGQEPGDDQLARILARVGSQRARLQLVPALRRFDLAAISTIHGLCRSILLDNAFESGIPFEAELEPELGDMLDELITDFWAAHVFEAPPLFVAYLDGSKITPGGMRELVRASVARPDRSLLPQDGPAFDPAGALAGAARRAKDAWDRSAGEVIRLLEQDPGVNRRRYTKRRLPEWLDQAAAFFFGDPAQARELPQGVRMLTRSSLAEKPASKAPPPRHAFFDACEDLVRAPAEQGLALRLALARYARAELRLRKARRQILSFDDLLLRLDEALRGPRGPVLAERMRERYAAALIDEFQDTDQVQYRILRAIFQTGRADGPPAFLIGDPKQSIYAFRGADIFAYLEAVADAGERRLSLGYNWRSDPGLVEAVNHLFARHPDPFGFDDIGFSPVRPRPGAEDGLRIDGRAPAALQLRFLPRAGLENRAGLINKGTAEDLLPELVAGDLQDLLDGRASVGDEALTAGDVAVLVRTNRQAAQLQEALRAHRIPSVLVSMQSVYHTREAEELSLVLRAVAEPGRADRLRSALATELLGLSGERIQSLGRDEAAWQALQDDVRQWRAAWEQGGVLRMLHGLLAWRPHPGAPSCLARLLSLTDGERRATNIAHLAELLQAEALGRQLGPAALIRWFDQQRLADAPAGDATQLRLESDERAVKLVTIHRSKGLQYPVVYCPYLWDAGGLTRRAREHDPVAFHDRAQGNRAMLDVGSASLQDHRDQARVEAFAESLRLTYVALTRARHLCVVAWGAVASMESSGLGYLLHHPEAERDPDRIAERVGALNDEELLADLQALAEGAGGYIGLGPFARAEPERSFEPPASVDALRCPPARRALARSPVTTSFTALVAAGAGLTPDEELGRDHDLAEQGARAGALSVPETGASRRTIPLAALQRGARTGDMLHWLFERLDFCGPRSHLDATAAEALARHGFEPDLWRAPLADAVGRVLETTLARSGAGLRLGGIPLDRRLNELEFLFSVDCEADLGPALAGLISRHPGPGVPAAYPTRLAGLGRRALVGFMRGFIDLVFVDSGRWYLVDYKSNHLGDRFVDYGAGRLSEAMQQHHYLLQYHLYCVALHRYLVARLGPGYDYERCFGGVYYLFVRGMSPETGADFGIFADRPPAALIEAMSDLLSGAPADGGAS